MSICPPALDDDGRARPSLSALDCLTNDCYGIQRICDQPILLVAVCISPGDVDDLANEKSRRKS